MTAKTSGLLLCRKRRVVAPAPLPVPALDGATKPRIKRLLTVAETTKYLGISTCTVARLLADDTLCRGHSVALDHLCEASIGERRASTRVGASFPCDETLLFTLMCNLKVPILRSQFRPCDEVFKIRTPLGGFEPRCVGVSHSDTFSSTRKMSRS